MSVTRLTLKEQIAELKARLHAHPYAQQLELHSCAELIHTLFSCGRKNVQALALEFLKDFPEYMTEFIAYYDKHKALMPLPEDPSKDPNNPLRLEYESLMEDLGSLIEQW